MKIAAGVLFVNVAFVALQIASSWPEWWKNINYEHSPLTWFSSVQLLAIAAVCFASAWLSRVRLWNALGAAFVFFALDERFQFHERLRDHVFKPRGIGVGLGFVGDGDFLFLIYAAIGLVVAWKLWAIVDRRWLGIAVAVALVAVLSDAAPIDTSDIPGARRDQFIEELCETAAQACFLICFCLYAQKHLPTTGIGFRDRK